jgi:hypothetical protein
MTAIYSVLFATTGSDVSEMDAFGLVMMSFSIASWLLPCILAFVIRSSMRVGVSCGVLGIVLLTIEWILGSSAFLGFVGDVISDSHYEPFVAVYTNVMSWLIASNWIALKVNGFIRPKSFIVVDLLFISGQVLYGVTGYLIARTFCPKRVEPVTTKLSDI